MTPESQRIAIAEACGWVDVEPSSLNPNIVVGRPAGAFKIEGRRTFLPDYLNDLNAMHEAEKVLTKDQWDVYYCKLSDTTAGNRKMFETHELVHATAAQRAEAFLRTLNLWTE